MKVTVELYGATKDLSKNKFLEFEIKKNSSIKDIKIQILDLIENSVFCSEKEEIISEKYKINENQKIGIIPPIGGG